ncbi:MAG: DUF2877 domain-containing protein [Chloroflexota bacterium]|nr:DUF2877 domain-containing protein [Chloroflexota bacterium]
MCIAGPDAPDGPLTLRVPYLATAQAALVGQPAAALQIAPGSLRLADRLHITWTAAQHWTPTYPQPTGSPTAQAAAHATLATAIAQSATQDGLGRLAPFLAELATGPLPPTLAADPLLRRAATTLAGFLVARRAADTEGATTALIRLIGLGPGLTPSGDDVVAGILATLVWTQPPDLDVAALVAAIRAAAPQHTNRISARLLWHAGAGTLYAPALALGTALLAGDSAAVAAPAQQLFALGHTSGVDLAVGLLAGRLAVGL